MTKRADIRKGNPRSGDIRSFFARSQAPSQASQASTQASQTSQPSQTPQPSQSAPPMRQPSPSPPPPSTPAPAPEFPLPAAASPTTSLPPSPAPLPDFPPSTPPSEPEPRRAVGRDAVIAASDDEGASDSDDSIVSLGIFAPKTTAPAATGPKPARSSARNQPCVTPRAKRMATAREFHSSPLTIQAKRSKTLDFASMLALNEKDNQARLSAQRFTALLDQEKREKDAEKQALLDLGDSGGDPMSLSQSTEDEGTAARKLKERMMESAVPHGEDDEKEGAAGDMRVARALERADVGASSKAYYFFEKNEPESALSTGQPFPTADATGVWSILADTQDRASHFQSGLPFDIQQHFKNLPDEIFLWVLDAVCSETRRDLAAEYVKLLRVCESQVGRLVTPDRLQQLFRSLGATRDVQHLSSPISERRQSNDPYPRRNWLCVENFLKLMGEVSTSFSPCTRTTAMQILLRLGMDPVAVENFGLLHEWRWTVDLVARSVPSSDWPSFCHDVCASLYASTGKATLRYRAISNLGPVSQQSPNTPAELQRRTLDLKRRLACAFVFDEPKRADTRPEDTVTIRAVIDRLDEDEFQLHAKTDFKELHALMMMLNVALGDASKHRVPVALGTTTTTTGENERDLSAEFDAEVDELAENMKSMVTRVAPLSKGIHVSRIEAKNAMELIRERLLYQVRIKPMAKIKMFGQGMDEDDEMSLPKQQDFMKQFLSARRTKGTSSTPGVEAEAMMA